MKISYDIRGLQEMVKAMEEVASDREIAKANKRVVQRTQTHVKESMRKHIPVSADNSKSGRSLKYGRESRPSHGHARDNIPVEPVKSSEPGPAARLAGIYRTTANTST